MIISLLSAPPVGICYKGCHHFLGLEKLSLSKNGKDDANEKIVNFEALELEEGDDPSTKMTELMTYLEENMEPDKFAEVKTLLGIGKDMSNADLLAAITKLVKPEKEEEDPDEEKELAEDGAKPDRAAFMKSCMEGGKDLATCTEEFKKKYPEPAKAEGADELAKLPEEVKAQMKTLTERVTELEGLKELAEVSTEVEKLISEKAVAPVQRDALIKMSAKMPEADRTEFLNFFRNTQKISVHRDVGIVASLKPGEVAGNDLTVARKKELIELHGLSGLIQDKADRSKLGFLEANN